MFICVSAILNAFFSGPSGVAPIIQPRSRGRPPIGPHQRTDLYGLAPVIYSSAASGTGTAPPAMPGRSNSTEF